MKWWEYLFPIHSPLSQPQTEDIPALESVKHPPIITRRGRVVYDRKTHFFSNGDLQRIASRVLDVNDQVKDDNFLLTLMEKLTIWMIEQLLDKFTGTLKAQIVSERLYYLARNFLARIIDRMLVEEQDQLRKEVSGGAH